MCYLLNLQKIVILKWYLDLKNQFFVVSHKFFLLNKDF